MIKWWLIYLASLGILCLCLPSIYSFVQASVDSEAYYGFAAIGFTTGLFCGLFFTDKRMDSGLFSSFLFSLLFVILIVAPPIAGAFYVSFYAIYFLVYLTKKTYCHLMTLRALAKHATKTLVT